MGGKIPRNIKTKVIRQWLHGLTREEIARENDIGAGTVTAIIQEARKQEEYQGIDLLRQVSLKLKEEGLELPSLAFAIRLDRIREENGINEDQIESIIQDFAAYCLRHKVSYDTVIQNGREALYLEQKFEVPIEKIPEYIFQGKETLDNLEDERQEILRKMQLAREERDTIVAELQKYGKDMPLIERIKQLEEELAETKRSEKNYKALSKRLAQDVEMLDNQNVEYSQWLSQSYKEIERLKEVNERLASENKELKIDFYNLKAAERQLAEND